VGALVIKGIGRRCARPGRDPIQKMDEEERGGTVCVITDRI